MIEPYYQDNHIKIFNKDCREMTELNDNSVQCVVTSPPYWGLREYSGEQELIWGDNHCEHQWQMKEGKYLNMVNAGEANRPWQEQARGKLPDSGFCSLCGAWKGAYGLEPTPEIYIEHTIEILREIRRVLRKDGVVFWNIGDSYSGSGRGADAKYANPNLSVDSLEVKPDWGMSGLKPKDLCLIPFRLAIAAQEGGWWVRSVIIWSKNNPMPESVTDRPTESHEYILMLTKSARYYWDADAVREAYTEPLNRWGGDTLKRDTKKTAAFKDEVLHLSPSSAFRVGNPIRPNPSGRNIRSVWEFPTQPFPAAHFAVFPEKLPEICIKAATPEVGCCSKCGAPWERRTKLTDEYKTLVARPLRDEAILDGLGEFLKSQRQRLDLSIKDMAKHFLSETGGITGCVWNWENDNNIPTLEQYAKLKDLLALDDRFDEDLSKYHTRAEGAWKSANPAYGVKRQTSDHVSQVPERTETLGWQPTCKCNADKVPSLVLDPFMGAGTTLWVAKKLTRQAIGYEISEEYCQLALERNRQQALNLGGTAR